MANGFLIEQGVGFPIITAAGYYSGPETTDAAAATHQSTQHPCAVGRYCVGGVSHACPPGRFGNTTALPTQACSGPCAPGYFCNTSASLTPFAHPCGGPQVYCPIGSVSPLLALPGEYTIGDDTMTRWSVVACPSASFCRDGVRSLCPAGRFGCSDRFSDPGCNGPCAAGHYCPPGTSSNQKFACGGTADAVDAATVYCPEGVGAPLPVGEGNYSVGSDEAAPHKRTAQERCEPGTYCQLGVKVWQCHCCITMSCVMKRVLTCSGMTMNHGVARQPLTVSSCRLLATTARVPGWTIRRDRRTE